MRVVLSHEPGRDVSEVRRALLGAGLECSAHDCVPSGDLLSRLAQVDAGLVVIDVDGATQTTWDAVREAQGLFCATTIAVTASQEAVEQRAKDAGVSLIIDRAKLRTDLDMALESITESQILTRARGQAIAVIAPTPGSGGTTVAANLAGVLAKRESQAVALVELARDFSDLALLLDVKPEHTIRELCQRWDRLDPANLEDCALLHGSGLRLLINADDQSGNEFLSPDSVRRIAILARVTFGVSVFALEARLGAEEVEAMRLSDVIALVVRPDVPAVRRAKWALGMLEDEGISRDRFRLVVNRWGQRGQLAMREVQETLGLKAVESIPDDPANVNKAANHGQLLGDLSKLSSIHRRFSALAKSLQALPVGS